MARAKTVRIDHDPAADTLTEGVLVAQPLCLPGQSQPPPAGETALNSILIGADRQIYCGTSGARAHVLVGSIHGETGAMRDAAVIPEATSVDGMAVNEGSENELFVVASSASGSALWRVEATAMRGLIQEWALAGRSNPSKVCDLFESTRVVHALPVLDGSAIAGIAEDGAVFLIPMDSHELRTVGQVDGPISARDRLVAYESGRVWGASANGELWVCDVTDERVECTGQFLPTLESGRPQTVTWAVDRHSGVVYGGTDPDGLLFTLDPQRRRLATIGKVSRLDGIGCLAVGHDGRVFGHAGENDDIGHLFCYDPGVGILRNLSIAVSTLSVRQYGYVFRCAATGAGGEIYFGQHERINHLWVYFPAISPGTKATMRH